MRTYDTLQKVKEQDPQVTPNNTVQTAKFPCKKAILTSRHTLAVPSADKLETVEVWRVLHDRKKHPNKSKML